ncbi:MAG TPA: DUF1993 domain-containing protein [Nevskiaceae bacterium]|nr:DUF1993 domain-containing protein [Nevskiaceae bacterium]
MPTMYQASVPVFIRMLGNIRNVLQKGAAHAQAKKFEPSVLVQARLAPDMFALARQIQIATDMAKGCAARLAGVELPKYEDNETTIDELVARIDKTVAFLKTFKPQQIDGSEGKAITLQMRTGERKFEGQPYLIDFVLPNFYFHLSTAYNILRHNGVEIGKMDFLGG